MSESNTAVQNLFEEFPPVSTEEWEAVIANDLKGADYKKKLRWHTGEGVAPLPFYRQEDLSQLDHLGMVTANQGQGWEVREAVYGSSIEQAKELIRDALVRGTEALQLSLKTEVKDDNYYLHGVPLQTQRDFHKLFDGISLAETPIHIDAGVLSPLFLELIGQEVESQNLSPSQISGSMLYDPFASMLRSGIPFTSEQIVQTTALGKNNAPNMRIAGVDARLYHNSGGTIIQELGFALATASEYLATLTEADYSAGEAAQMLHFTFAAGSNYFLEIAKFRAIRLLWQNLIQAYGVDPSESPAYVHVETSQWNKTGYDPYTNMLRTTTEGISAVLGGCDALTVLPFDASFRQPNAFSQRIARNAQIIMREEAYLNKVQDPATGSYYVEKLTDDIARKAWQLFQEVEERGGMLQAIEDGFVQSEIKKSRQKRDQAIATRRRIFVGTNQYPNPDERQAEELKRPIEPTPLITTDRDEKINSSCSIDELGDLFAQGATLGDIASSILSQGDPEVNVLSPYRGARAFEELRLATEQHPTTPMVLNLPIGHPKMRKARSAFSNNFFGCVGYDIEDPIGFEDVSEAVEAIKEEQPEIAVLCSSDKEYEQLVPELCDQLAKTKQRPLLVLAGYPEEQVESYRKLGVDLFIYSGCNVLETLKKVQQKLGIIEHR